MTDIKDFIGSLEYLHSVLSSNHVQRQERISLTKGLISNMIFNLKQEVKYDE